MKSSRRNKSFSKSAYFFLVLSLIWTSFIFYTSLLPGDQLPQKPWMAMVHFDKIVHFVFYYLLMTFYLSFLMRLVIENTLYQYLTWTALVLAILIGVSIEFLQSSEWANRHFELSDIIINITGALVAFVHRPKLKFLAL